MEEKSYDIIIIGSGLIGVSIALALQPLKLNIALCEKNLPDFVQKENQPQRPLSLSYGSQNIFKKMGLWQELEPYAAPIAAVHVSEQHRLGVLKFLAEEEKIPALGYVIAAQKLHQILYQSLAQHKNIDFVSLKHIEKIIDEQGVKVVLQTVQGNKTLKGKLLIACDGTQSDCRKLLKISAQESDYQQTSVTGQLHHSRSHHQFAYQRFTRQSILALVPGLEPNQSYWVWTTDQKLADEIKSMTGKQLEVRLQQFFGDRLGAFHNVQVTGAFPLQVVKATQQIKPGVVLLGNAAHTLYPIAAQGFNLGLRDVAVLSAIITTAHKNQQELGSEEVLRAYLEQRQQDQQATMNLTENILLTFELPLIGPLRGIGMMGADLLQPLKKRLAQKLLGKVKAIL